MKLKSLFIGFATAAILFTFGIVAANAIDFVRYRAALARINSLTPAQIQTIADYCQKVENTRDFGSKDTPVVLKPLQPSYVYLSSAHCVIILYANRQLSLSLRVKSSSQNQEVYYVSHLGGIPEVHTIWWRYPKLAEELHPTNRIVSISTSRTHRDSERMENREWIVTPDALLVIDDKPQTGKMEEDCVLAKVQLRAEDTQLITKLVNEIPLKLHEKYIYPVTSGPTYYSFCTLSFLSKQSNHEVTIELMRTWVSELGPLFDAIEKLCPTESPILFPQKTASEYASNPHEMLSRKKAWKMSFPRSTERSWWCFWPAVVDSCR